jgi:hypothetical protein
MVPGRPQAVVLGRERRKSRVTGLQGRSRIARTEPCFIEVVRFRGQSRPSRYQGLGHFVRRRLRAWVQYDLPFRLQVTAFSFGFSDCGAKRFADWTFEAFDGEEWRQLCYSADSPWPGMGLSLRNRPVVFWLPDAADFGSNRFRIRLAESNRASFRCMHIRGLELFGTILPPWRID